MIDFVHIIPRKIHISINGLLKIHVLSSQQNVKVRLYIDMPAGNEHGIGAMAWQGSGPETMNKTVRPDSPAMFRLLCISVVQKQ
jgi:hypothetical protein